MKYLTLDLVVSKSTVDLWLTHGFLALRLPEVHRAKKQQNSGMAIWKLGWVSEVVLITSIQASSSRIA